MDYKVFLRQMAEAKIAQYRKEQIGPRKAIALIDAGKSRHQEPGPNGFMVDCTAAWRARCVARVARLDHVIKTWARELA